MQLFKKKVFSFILPLSGEVMDIKGVTDDVFSSKMMGDGFAVRPTEGKVYSPVNGEVMMIFPTNHAIGLKDQVGNEWLIHIGMDTVNLGGKGFNLHVREGQKIKQGQLIIEFDYDVVNELVPSLVTPIVLTNCEGAEVKLLKAGYHTAKTSDLIEIIRN